QHLGAKERAVRVANALTMLRQGELEPAGVMVARRASEVQAAIVCLVVPGASALVWPPQSRNQPDRREIEDRLVGYATSWLRQRGAKLGQALLAPEDAHLAHPLERNGFVHITGLWYLRHDLDG